MKFREQTFVTVRNIVSGELGEMTITTEFDSVIRQTGINPVAVAVSINNAVNLEVLHQCHTGSYEVADTDEHG